MTASPLCDNPLLDLSGLPRFDAIVPSDVQPAIGKLLDDCRALIVRLTTEGATTTWDSFAAALSDGLEPLSRAWGVVGHLHAVNDVPEWREAYNRMLPEVSRFYAELGQNLKLFAAYQAIAGSAEYARLSPTRQRIIDNEIRDFRLAGAELRDDQKPRFQAIAEELSQLSAKFSENLLDATNAFAELVSDEAELAGLPDDARQAAAEAAEKDGHDGWKFTLHMPSYLPVMQYADSRRLRAVMYRAYATRAAEFGAAELDNTPLIGQILRLRREEAQMLGYASSPKCRWCQKWPIRCPRYWPFCATWRSRPGPSPNGTLPTCAPSRVASCNSRTSSPGTSPTFPKSSCNSGTPSPSRK
jgi:oligopeptidase A (EC:3.4.24.70). Metallo peptidase. MEROPS family M03A